MKLYKLFTKLVTEILPLLFWILLIFGFDKVYMATLTIISAVIHEAGHYIAIILLKCDTGAPVGHISGFRIRQKQITSYTKNIIIFAAGPFSNFLFTLILLPFVFADRYFLTACIINFATALSNLLPIKGYDGFSILSEFLKSRSCDGGIRLLSAVSFALSAVLLFLSLYMMYFYNEGYWIFGIFLANLMSEMSYKLNLTVCENN